MNAFPRRTLHKLVNHYGRDLAVDPRRTQALLRDLCGPYKREINALIAAMREGIPNDLLASPRNAPPEMLLSRLTRRMHDDAGISEDLARWAVESWALALEVINPDELDHSIIRTVPAPSTQPTQHAHVALSPPPPIVTSNLVPPLADTNSSSPIWLALLKALGASLGMLVAFFLLYGAVAAAQQEAPSASGVIAWTWIVFLLVDYFAVWLWMGRPVGRSCGVVRGMFCVAAMPVYVFKQSRGTLSRSTGGPAPSYPTLLNGSAMVGTAIVMLVTASVFGQPQSGPSQPGLVGEQHTRTPVPDPTRTPVPDPTRTPVPLIAEVSPSDSVSVVESNQDALDAAATATQLSVFEATGNFTALYDRIHPDARAVIPSAVVIGWYENEFAPLGPGISTVTGVRFVTWTWGVTGQVYPYTAEVSYEQPLADGTIMVEAIRLVQDINGNWGWFFGRNWPFVEDQMEKYMFVSPLKHLGFVPRPTKFRFGTIIH